MATLTANITLTSTDLLTDSLSLTVSNNLTVLQGGIFRSTVTATSTGASATTIYTADDYAAPCYIYIKNTDATATDYLYVYDDTSTGDPVELKLSGGEWAWMPTNADKTLRVYAATTGTVVEYGIFGTDQ
jgi:hypothetical protein|tara:strand:+ start:1287 stop:1676 length:390 start_codon:yes stop_codon:yes gene_type:complete